MKRELCLVTVMVAGLWQWGAQDALGASGGEDGVVAEHCYEHDDGVADSAGCGGEAAGDG